ncbi:MAG: hypothetical protein A2W31_02805 [Planctomycetes bacterium RBG_16_64_10]|nr:MAG: hypothetical protein A2W31_02805 [Planctomycetes bacterium RBG_16_64_10]
MYFDDHNPPHFHAIYGTAEAELGMEPIALLRGRLPRRAFGMVMEWAVAHQDELLANWELMRHDQPPNRIDPLDSELTRCFPVYVASDTSETTDSNLPFRMVP